MYFCIRNDIKAPFHNQLQEHSFMRIGFIPKDKLFFGNER